MDIDAFILVGGKSNRFGRDKATLRFRGTTLVERTALTIRKALSSPRVTLVAASSEQIATIFSYEEPLPFVFDVHQNRGPLGAVHAALANAQTEWVFIVACDFPMITDSLLQHLSGHISDDTDAVVPIQGDGKIQPLCALYRVKSCLLATEKPMIKNRPTPPVKTVFEQVRTCFVSFNELTHLPGSQNFFLNLNTPEDFVFASRILSEGTEK